MKKTIILVAVVFVASCAEAPSAPTSMPAPTEELTEKPIEEIASIDLLVSQNELPAGVSLGQLRTGDHDLRMQGPQQSQVELAVYLEFSYRGAVAGGLSIVVLPDETAAYLVYASNHKGDPYAGEGPWAEAQLHEDSLSTRFFFQLCRSVVYVNFEDVESAEAAIAYGTALANRLEPIVCQSD